MHVPRAAGASRPEKWSTRRLASLVLLLVAVTYLAYIIAEQWSVLIDAVERLHLSRVLLASALLIAMLALKSSYHVLAIRRLGSRKDPPGSRIVLAYATSQVIRYLPGKVLGVVYEAERLAPHVPAYRVIGANVIQGLLTSALTAGVVLSVGAGIYFGSTPVAVAALCGVFAALLIAHRLQLTERFINRAARLIPRFQTLPKLTDAPSRSSALGSLILLTEWIPYYAFWCLMLPSHSASLGEAILLGSCYAGASLIANFAIVMPSGLVVREALFLWVGSQLSLDVASLILLGIISRVLFTVSDLLFVPVAWVFDRVMTRERA